MSAVALAPPCDAPLRRYFDDLTFARKFIGAEACAPLDFVAGDANRLKAFCGRRERLAGLPLRKDGAHGRRDDHAMLDTLHAQCALRTTFVQASALFMNRS